MYVQYLLDERTFQPNINIQHLLQGQERTTEIEGNMFYKIVRSRGIGFIDHSHLPPITEIG